MVRVRVRVRVIIMVVNGRRLVVNRGRLVVNMGHLVVNKGLGCKWGVPGCKQWALFGDLVVNKRHNGILVLNFGSKQWSFCSQISNFKISSYFRDFFRVKCCVEIVTTFICKYISFCTIHYFLIQLISAFRYELSSWWQ